MSPRFFSMQLSAQLVSFQDFHKQYVETHQLRRHMAEIVVRYLNVRTYIFQSVL